MLKQDPLVILSAIIFVINTENNKKIYIFVVLVSGSNTHVHENDKKYPSKT